MLAAESKITAEIERLDASVSQVIKDAGSSVGDPIALQDRFNALLLQADRLGNEWLVEHRGLAWLDDQDYFENPRWQTYLNVDRHLSRLWANLGQAKEQLRSSRLRNNLGSNRPRQVSF